MLTPRLAAALAIALVALPPKATAQEFTGFIGTQHDRSTSAPTTYQWRLDYQQGISEHFYWEAGWVNDGHIPGHYRDGIAAQIGIRTKVSPRHFVIGLAAGVDRFYDTVVDTLNPAGFGDVQGWMFLGTAQLSWYQKRWIARLQANLEQAPASSFNAWSFLLGLGYQLQAPDEKDTPRDRPAPQPNFTTHDEVTLFIGQTVENGFSGAPKGIAGMAEYRHGIARYLDLTFSWINQGDNAVISRVGVASQIWPTRAFGPVTLGLGLGAFFALSAPLRDANGNEYPSVAGMVSPTASYRFGEHWTTRFLWNRTVTTSNTNTDYFSLGLGWRW